MSPFGPFTVASGGPVGPCQIVVEIVHYSAQEQHSQVHVCIIGTCLYITTLAVRSSIAWVQCGCCQPVFGQCHCVYFGSQGGKVTIYNNNQGYHLIQCSLYIYTIISSSQHQQTICMYDCLDMYKIMIANRAYLITFSNTQNCSSCWISACLHNSNVDECQFKCLFCYWRIVYYYFHHRGSGISINSPVTHMSLDLLLTLDSHVVLYKSCILSVLALP